MRIWSNFRASSWRLAAIALLFIAASVCRALDPARATHQLGVDEWKASAGLPADAAQVVAQTRDGYLWVGTSNGLARFDGVEFTVFNKENTPAFVTSSVLALCEAADGTLWIGTDRGGIVWMRNGQFVRATIQDLASVSVSALARDGDDMIVGTSEGVLRARGKNLEQLVTGNDLRVPNLRQLLLTRDGTLWLAGDSVARVGLRAGGNTPGQGGSIPAAVQAIRVLCDKRGGGLWIGTAHGLVRFEEGRVEILTTTDGLASNTILSLLEDRDGSLWVGLPNGLQRFANGRWSEVHARTGESLDAVIAMFEDREGNIWVGTRSGLVRLRDLNVTTLSRAEGLSQSYVTTLLAARDGSTWAGTWGGGLNHITAEGARILRRQDGLFNDSVSTLGEDHDGGVWIGYQGGGLSRYAQGKFRHFGPDDGVPDDRVRAIVTDRDGTVWIGGNTIGLSRFRGGRFTRVEAAPIAAMMVDSKNGLWVGSESGIGRLAAERWTPFRTSDGLRGTVTYAFREDSRGSVWIARKDGGLQRVRDGKVEAFVIARDATTSFFGIEEIDGALWLSCRAGIVRVALDEFDAVIEGRKREVAYKLLGESDGIRPGGFSVGGHPTSVRTANDEAWFGATYGIARVEPRHMISNPVTPTVAVVGIDYAKRAFAPQGSLELPPGNGLVAFRFTSLSLTDATRNQFKYRLHGVDSDWIEAGSARVANYAGISPGSYRFEVMGSNNDGVWSERSAACEVQVQPHIYQTLWFWLVCVIGGGGLVAAAYRWALRLHRKREKRLRQLVEEQTNDLRRAKEVAEAASRAKSDFVANMSHELRTPLNGVLGMTQLALSVATSEEQREYLGIARSSGESLLAIIGDILDFSKIESGRMTLEPRNFDLHECVETVVDLLGVQAAAKGLEFVLRLDPACPRWVVGDPARVRQVLMNLIGNAVKFTDAGEIVLSLAPAEGDPNHQLLRFCVADTGVGIPAEKISTIFDAFLQADGSMTRRFGGNGLGLTIARSIVDLMGGRIWVESEVRKGSQFFFTVNLPRAAGAGERTESHPELKGCSVLIIDDNETNRVTIRDIMERAGMVPTIAKSGSQAITLASALHARDEKHFDFVFADALMPECDGFQTVRELEKIGPYAKRTIMMLSAGDQQDGMQRCRELGVGAHLRKPVSRRRLFEVMVGLVSVKHGGKSLVSATDSDGIPVPARRWRILVTEDNPVNQQIARAKLTKAGHDVVLADNGAEAVRKWSEGAFDVILMDVQMPEMNGWEATAEIRKRERGSGRHVPIIAVTAHALSEDVERCRAAGMDAHVPKPVNWQEILREIARLVVADRAPAEAEAGSVAANSDR